MENRDGLLVEISPWGTGFIEDSSGKLFGFHHSMLDGCGDSPESGWPEYLENKPVTFNVADGEASHVVLHEFSLPAVVSALAAKVSS